MAIAAGAAAPAAMPGPMKYGLPLRRNPAYISGPDFSTSCIMWSFPKKHAKSTGWGMYFLSRQWFFDGISKES
ncbi:MAG: hypothetical protein AABZ67_13390 [Pseudomonadota bacterium]